MQKTSDEFKLWNIEKKKIEASPKKKINVLVWELCWYKEGVNVGKEQSKWVVGNFSRIGLVISTKLSGLVAVAPITSHWKKKRPYLLPISEAEKHGLRPNSALIINQLRVIDKKRIISIHKKWKPFSVKFANKVFEEFSKFF